MAKLRGKAKAAFLKRMEAGRKKAARKGKPKAGGAKKRRRAPAKGKRKNETLMTLLQNPAGKTLRAAIRDSARFHGAEPKYLTKLPGDDTVLVELGKADEVLYSPTHGRRRGPWFHRFGKGAIVAVPYGKNGKPIKGELRILSKGAGRRFKFDPERGIVG